MYIAFALRTEPELELVQLSFCLTEPECRAAVAQLCQHFADDVPVELDWVGFPDEPMPTPAQISDPSYIQTIQERVFEAFTDEPFEAETRLIGESGSGDAEFVARKSTASRLAELQQLERAGLITQSESKRRFQDILETMGKGESGA